MELQVSYDLGGAFFFLLQAVARGVSVVRIKCPNEKCRALRNARARLLAKVRRAVRCVAGRKPTEASPRRAPRPQGFTGKWTCGGSVLWTVERGWAWQGRCFWWTRSHRKPSSLALDIAQCTRRGEVTTHALTLCGLMPAKLRAVRHLALGGAAGCRLQMSPGGQRTERADECPDREPQIKFSTRRAQTLRQRNARSEIRGAEKWTIQRWWW